MALPKWYQLTPWQSSAPCSGPTLPANSRTSTTHPVNSLSPPLLSPAQPRPSPPGHGPLRWEPAGTAPSLTSPSPKHRVQRRVPGPHRCQQPIPGAAVGHILLTAETPEAWGTRAGERGHMVRAGAGATGTAQTLVHVLSTVGAGEARGTGAGEGAQGGVAGAPVQARVCEAEEPGHSSARSLRVPMTVTSGRAQPLR